MNLPGAGQLAVDVLLLPVAAGFGLRLWARGAGLRGLLAGKTDGTKVIPERVQLLLVTLVIAGQYLVQVIVAQGNSVPPVGPLRLWIFGLSCAVYASGNALRTYG
jgi:hypothetical protein